MPKGMCIVFVTCVYFLLTSATPTIDPKKGQTPHKFGDPVIINVRYKLPCCMGDSDIVDHWLRQEERRNQ